MFSFTSVLLALALVASASANPLDDNSSSKTAGIRTNKETSLLAFIDDAQCNARLDLSFVENCNNVGVYARLRDNDAAPLITIAGDLSHVDFKREGHCRGELLGFVTVYCEEAARQTLQWH